jgi:hypothetical protein
LLTFVKIELGTIFGGEPETSREGEPEEGLLAGFLQDKKKERCATKST